MTIEELLRELQTYRGKGWPTAALRRLLILAMMPVLAMTENEIQEFKLLYRWALEMIEAGIAFKQSQELEA